MATITRTNTPWIPILGKAVKTLPLPLLSIIAATHVTRKLQIIVPAIVGATARNRANTRASTIVTADTVLRRYSLIQILAPTQELGEDIVDVVLDNCSRIESFVSRFLKTRAQNMICKMVIPCTFFLFGVHNYWEVGN